MPLRVKTVVQAAAPGSGLGQTSRRAEIQKPSQPLPPGYPRDAPKIAQPRWPLSRE